MRAREPDETGFVERDGVPVYWERFGDGSPTVLFMPTWSIVHSRCWKAQVPYFARHFRVVVFDGRGNGRSGRPADSAAYAESEFAADAVAVMDATETEQAVVVSWSRGAQRSLLLAAKHPERVLGAVFVCPALPLVGVAPDRARYIGRFTERLDTAAGWAKWNMHHWEENYRDFLDFFMAKIFTERHSTKQIEDAVGWGLETDPATLAATVLGPWIETREDVLGLCERMSCPVLVVHGEEDAVRPVESGRELAAATGGEFVGLAGVGHGPHLRKPVFFNALLKGFVEREARAPALTGATTGSTKGDSQ